MHNMGGGGAQDLIAVGPGGRDGAVPLLDRNRRLKRKPQWLDNTVATQRMPAALRAPPV